VSTVLTNKSNKRVSENRNVEAVRCRVDDRDQVLMLAYSHENLELNQGSCSRKTQ